MTEANIVQLDTIEKVSDYVISKIGNYVHNGELMMPANYSASSAIKSAYMIIQQDRNLQTCTKQSIVESMLKMAVLGLNPAQSQCYFIAKGGKACLDVSYFGKQAICRRIKGVLDISAQAIFQGDTIEYDVELGSIINLKHNTKFENRNNEVIGAYAVIHLDSDIFGRPNHIEIMTLAEVKSAWGQGATNGASPAHKKFPQEMAKKSVINRAIKNFINGINSNEHNARFIEAFNNIVTDEYIEIENKPPLKSLKEKLSEAPAIEQKEVDYFLAEYDADEKEPVIIETTAADYKKMSEGE